MRARVDPSLVHAGRAEALRLGPGTPGPRKHDLVGSCAVTGGLPHWLTPLVRRFLPRRCVRGPASPSLPKHSVMPKDTDKPKGKHGGARAKCGRKPKPPPVRPGESLGRCSAPAKHPVACSRSAGSVVTGQGGVPSAFFDAQRIQAETRALVSESASPVPSTSAPPPAPPPAAAHIPSPLDRSLDDFREALHELQLDDTASMSSDARARRRLRTRSGARVKML
jgi:hypothetical protein